MKLTPEPSSHREGVHWTVRMNRRNRSAFYVLLFLAMGSHLLATGAPAWAWAALVLHYLIYPQLAYWRACRSSDQRRAEMHNMDADIVLAGIWLGALGFPLWITFIMCASGCINMVVFHGARGGVRLVVSMAAGIALAAITALPSWHPDTDLRTSLLCMLALGLYLFAFARDGYDRAMAQYQVHAQLRGQFDEIRSLQAQLREQALRDPLTGLFNRRQLDAALAPALRRCREQGTPLSVLLIDIDHFKRSPGCCCAMRARRTWRAASAAKSSCWCWTTCRWPRPSNGRRNCARHSRPCGCAPKARNSPPRCRAAWRLSPSTRTSPRPCLPVPTRPSTQPRSRAATAS